MTADALADVWTTQALAHIDRPTMPPVRESAEWARTVHARQMLAVVDNLRAGQHTTDEEADGDT